MPKAKAKPIHVGATIRQLRESVPLGQAELARRSAITPQGLSKIETGQSEPGWETCCRIADALGVGVEKLRA